MIPHGHLEQCTVEEMAQVALEMGREVDVRFFGPEQVVGFVGEVTLMAFLGSLVCPILEMKKRPRSGWASPLRDQWLALFNDPISLLGLAGGQAILIPGVVGPSVEEEWPRDEGSEGPS